MLTSATSVITLCDFCCQIACFTWFRRTNSDRQTLAAKHAGNWAVGRSYSVKKINQRLPTPLFVRCSVQGERSYPPPVAEPVPSLREAVADAKGALE